MPKSSPSRDSTTPTRSAAKKRVAKAERAVSGGVKTASALRKIAAALLKAGAGLTVAESAQRLGLVPHDVKNLRSDNLPGLQLLLRLVGTGRYSPRELIRNHKLKKLPAGFAIGPVSQQAIAARVRALTFSDTLTNLNTKTGL